MDLYKIEKNDNVAVALRVIKPGEKFDVDNKKITAMEEIPQAHKIAVTEIKKDDPILKYGNVMGYATEDIKPGYWVHTHNVRVASEGFVEYTYNFDKNNVIMPGSKVTNATFMGYKRNDGQTGIRNHLLVLPTVFCANGPASEMADMINEKYNKSKNFDGAIALPHSNGCSQVGNDLEMTSKIIAGMVHNANFGGVIVVSLGCEVNDLKQMMPYIGEYDKKRVKFIVLQEVEDEFEEALKLADEIMEEMSEDHREKLPLKDLHIAVNCGGSDGHSGITANKVVGMLTDRLVAEDATVNMTEVPEMFGAEHILMNRAVDEGVFQDIVDMINGYKEYFAKYGVAAADNPTQGNKEGGLTTIQDKSLGCTNKGGNCAVSQVLGYGDRATKHGFVLVTGPGNDLAGISAQVAAGAVMVVFTTGRGTPCGFAAPTFRLSSNTPLAKKKTAWIDYDAGRLLEADTEKKKNALAEQLYEMVIETANGTFIPYAERKGYRQLGMLRDGVTD